jgi:hypothetical protein
MQTLTVKDQIFEVLANCKVGLIGSGVMLATQAVVEISGERQVRFLMMYIGLIVGILTITKLLFELGPAWEKFKDALCKRQKRKHREQNNRME